MPVLTLPAAATAPGTARRWLCAELAAAGLRGEVVEEAALVASELVTNAVRHARPPSAEGFRLTCEVHGGAVLVSVTDGGGPTVPAAVRFDDAATGGRGLAIVDRLAGRWGVARTGAGSTVWAEVAPHPSVP